MSTQEIRIMPYVNIKVTREGTSLNPEWFRGIQTFTHDLEIP